jgi:TPP-dependent pyruvate/acetoin dehydrogenase alpha subunit
MDPANQKFPLEREPLLAIYRDMVRIREFEESCPKLYCQGKIGGFLHLYSWSGNGSGRGSTCH